MIAVIQGAVSAEFSASIAGKAGPEFPAFGVKGKFTVSLSGEPRQSSQELLQYVNRKSCKAASVKIAGMGDDFQPDTGRRGFSRFCLGELKN